MPDHEVHEIQLNGKQLVFTFMAATVVSVVIFLFGVMVGRGVRQPQADVLAASADALVDPATSPDTGNSETSLPADPPAPAQDTLTYAEHLEARVPPAEPLKSAEPKATAAPPAPEKTLPVKAVVERRDPPPAPKAPLAKSGPTPVSARFAEPSGKGFVVQVAVRSELADAEAFAGQLQSKGYRTFVALNEAGPQNARYRVRIGKYPTRSEALAVSQKLQREERLKPWVP
jgi:septal ring-binding cell division protein DamX